jgi:hypothetical protein
VLIARVVEKNDVVAVQRNITLPLAEKVLNQVEYAQRPLKRFDFSNIW